MIYRTNDASGDIQQNNIQQNNTWQNRTISSTAPDQLLPRIPVQYNVSVHGYDCEPLFRMRLHHNSGAANAAKEDE